jgi:hypothetical protein
MRWERGGCVAGSSRDSHSSPTPAPQISTGWEKLASNLMQRMIPPLFPRIVGIISRMHLVCLALQNVARTDCCVRVRRPASMTFSCSRHMTLRAARTCRRPRSRCLKESCARGSEDSPCTPGNAEGSTGYFATQSRGLGAFREADASGRQGVRILSSARYPTLPEP